MVINRLRLLIILGVLVVGSWFTTVVGAGGPVAPKTKFNFTTLGKWNTHSIEVDKTTVASMVDKDGDTLVGAVFQITLVEPLNSGNGKTVSTFVNSVVGVCGYDGVLLLDSKTFDPEGKFVGEDVAMKPYTDMKQASTPVTEMYKFLCDKVQQKRYKQERGNNYI